MRGLTPAPKKNAPLRGAGAGFLSRRSLGGVGTPALSLES